MATDDDYLDGGRIYEFEADAQAFERRALERLKTNVPGVGDVKESSTVFDDFADAIGPFGRPFKAGKKLVEYATGESSVKDDFISGVKNYAFMILGIIFIVLAIWVPMARPTLAAVAKATSAVK